jgi:hypothetical protein
VDDRLDLVLGSALADELLDQHQVVRIHPASKVAAPTEPVGNPSGNQVDYG